MGKILPMVAKTQPWGPADATDEIRRIARSDDLTLTYRGQAKQQLAARGLYTGDVLCALKNGFVYSDAQPSTKRGLHKYSLECETPNSHGRSVRIVVIPDPNYVWLKIITVLWVDE